MLNAAGAVSAAPWHRPPPASRRSCVPRSSFAGVGSRYRRGAAPDGRATPRGPAPLLRISRTAGGRAARHREHDDEGDLRGAPVSLRLDGSLLTGKVGDTSVPVVRNDQARALGGVTLLCSVPNASGGVMRGWVPGHSIGVELGGRV